MSKSESGDCGNTPDDGTELVNKLLRLAQMSEQDSSDDSDVLETVSEHSYHSEQTGPSRQATYSTVTKKNLPGEEVSLDESRSSRPSYLLNFEKEHFHRENVMPDRPYTAFFTTPTDTYTTKNIFDTLLRDAIPASAVRCLQRSPNGNVLITFALRKYHDLFVRKPSFVVRQQHHVIHPGCRRLTFVTI